MEPHQPRKNPPPLQPERPGIFQTIFRILLGAFLTFAGVTHLTTARVEFLAQVPPWVPLDPDLVVVLSGLVEIALGLGLVFLPRRQVLFGLAAAAFFVLIFPGNLSQYANRIDAFGLNTDRARFIRLFFQPLLVLWALWATGAWRALRAGGWKRLWEPR
ncbi:MAG: hypothetical protein ACKOC5_14515 [Chloroflexota bacterium]